MTLSIAMYRYTVGEAILGDKVTMQLVETLENAVDLLKTYFWRIRALRIRNHRKRMRNLKTRSEGSSTLYDRYLTENHKFIQ